MEKSQQVSLRQNFSNNTSNSSNAEIQTNRLIDLAVTVRYQRGKAQFKAIAVPDQIFEAADWETKLRMVKYLQDLRLLLWLLRGDTYASNRSSHFCYITSSSSCLYSETDLASRWMLGSVLETKDYHCELMVNRWSEDHLEHSREVRDNLNWLVSRTCRILSLLNGRGITFFTLVVSNAYLRRVIHATQVKANQSYAIHCGEYITLYNYINYLAGCCWYLLASGRAVDIKRSRRNF